MILADENRRGGGRSSWITRAQPAYVIYEGVIYSASGDGKVGDVDGRDV